VLTGRDGPPAPRASEVRRVALVTFLYIALTLALAAPLSLHPASRVLVDNPDTHLYIWTLAWDVHAFTARPSAIFDANIYYPYNGTLAYSENLLGSALVAAPVIWLTGDLVLALNLVQLSTCVLCGLGAHLLARRAGLSALGATLAGMVFLAAPPRFFRLGQLHLTAVQWVPFGLAFLHSYLDNRRPRDLRWAIAFFTLQALTSGHGAVFLGVAAVTLVLYRLASGERIAPRRLSADVGVLGLALLAPLAVLYAPYRAAQREVGLVRSLENWLPTPSSYLASPSHLHQFLRGLVTDVDFNRTASAWLFPGFTVLVLAGAALARGPRTPGRDIGPFYVLLAIIALLFFLPEPIGLWPYVYSLPGFNFIRVPSRFMILATLALGIAAAAGFDHLMSRLAAPRRALAAAACGALLLAEYASMPLDTVPYAVEVPAVDRWLDTQPKPFVVAEAPVPSPGNIGAYERFQTMAMLHATAHWQKTVHGYSGIRPPLHDRLYKALNAFPDRASLDSLRSLGVTYIVVHEEQVPPDRRAALEDRLTRFAGEIELVHQDGEGRVYRIRVKS
jgi:hypothetical protein